jgi:hypothetical protein
MLIVLALLLQSARPAAQDLSWLTGCWELTRGTRHVTEQWMRPEGGTLIGTSRTTADGKTLEYEFIVIREAAGGFEFVAKPSGQPEAIFKSTRIAAGEVVFENPTHDFPTRITYRAAAAGLYAAVEGDVNGQKRVIEFPYRPCRYSS